MKKLILVFVAILGIAVMSNNLSAQTKTTADKATVKTTKTVATPANTVTKDKAVTCDKHPAKAKDCGTEKSAAKSCGDHKGKACGGCKHGKTEKSTAVPVK